MGLITTEVKMTWKNNTKTWYINKGYIFTKSTDEFFVKVSDLTPKSTVKVMVKCDCCGKIYELSWYNFSRYIKEDGKLFCNNCAKKLFGKEKEVKTKLLNSKSFEQWCVENNKQDILDRWDYKLNGCKPSDLSYATTKKVYFKCPRGIHKSELKCISNFSSGQEGSIRCNQCNSFAQWGVDNICPDFLEKYWDYEKNTNINPWIIPSQWNKRVWIKCQEKDYHESYKIICNNFHRGNRCPYCSKTNEKVHALDSLGKLLEDNNLLYLWSKKNEISSYEYATMSNKVVWFKCPDGKHEDFLRKICNSCIYDFRCPDCNFSKGEKSIENILKNRNINFIPQKEFDGLVGLKGGNLSYDFYLPEYNLLIEYQGEFHDGSGGEYTKTNLQKQKKHDKYKYEYAKDHNIKLLEIWYYDFDKIDEILINELNIK